MKHVNCKLKTKFLLILSFSNLLLLAQKEDYNWSFGEGVGITFNTTPASTYTHGFVADYLVYESMASISDANGNLLFYTNGLSVLQANGTIMAGGNNTLKGADDGGGVSASQGVLVIGAPKNPNLFYVFTCDAGNVPTIGFHYATVDMTANGGLGQVSPSTRLKTDAGANFRTTEMIAATKHANGCDIWIVTRDAQQNIFYSYLITSSGINVNATIKSTYAGLVPGGYLNPDEGRGSMTFSNLGDKFAIAHHAQWPYENSLSLFNFNTTTGAITLSSELGNTLMDPNGYDQGYDVVWSPNDSKIYVSYINVFDINQYDVSAWGNRAAIKATQTKVTGTQTAAAGGSASPSGQLLIGPDGKLYRAMKGTRYLATITGNLDGAAAALTYNNQAVSLGTNFSDAALPNMIPRLIALANIDTSGINPICNTDASFNLSATPSGGSWSASCGPCITNSSLGTFSPGIAGAGNHTITYTITSCNTDAKVISLGNCAVGCGDTSLASSIPNSCTSAGNFDLDMYKGTSAAGSWSIVNGPVGYSATVASDGHTFNFNNTIGGTYTVKHTLTTVNPGCPDGASRTFVINALPVPIVANHAICAGDPPATFDAGAGFITYLWSVNGTGGTQTTSGTVAGNYTCTVTNAAGCSASATGVLTVNTLPIAPVIANKSICAGDPPATFDAGAGYISYTWSVNGTGIAQTTTGTTAGNYTCTVTNAAGCSASATAVLTVNALPAAPVIANKSICAGDPSASFDAGADYISYTWSVNGTGTAQTTSGTTPGNYTCEVTDINGCKASATATLTVNNLPSVSLADNKVCAGGSISLSPVPNNFISYKWHTGATTSSINYSAPNTTAWVKVTDNNGCSDTAFAQISNGDTLHVDFGGNKQICQNENLVLNAAQYGPFQAPVTYAWDNVAGNSTKTISQSGSYGVVVMDGKGCTGSDTVQLTVNPLPVINLGNDTTVCFSGKEIFKYTLTSKYNTIQWSNGSLDTTVTQDFAEALSVTVSNNFACKASDTIVITEHCEPVILCYPNVTTPNGDGVNDNFIAMECPHVKIDDGNYKGFIDNLIDIHFIVVNRWGIKMFESENVMPLWDGNFNGEPVSPGVYYWIVNYTNTAHQHHEQTGWVQVVR